MRNFLFVMFLGAVAPACNSLCEVGVNCPAKQKKGDLKLNNKTDWTIIDSTIQCDQVDCSWVTIKPNESVRFYDVLMKDDGTYVFVLRYQPPSGLDTANMDLTYYIDMIPDTLTNLDLGGEKAWGDWITPFNTDYTATYPELPQPPPPSSGSGGAGGDACAGASTGPCLGLGNQCKACGSGTGCQAPCYCVAACLCHYCGDTSCEAGNRQSAASLGTTCSY